MASNEVWGIDVGKSGLKAVKVRRNKDQVEIVGIEIIEYEQTSESENTDKDELVQQALTEFQARNKIKNEKIYVSIPGQATFNRMITIPPVETKRVKELVTFEAQQQIPFPIEEVLWDYQMIGSKDKTQEEREIMLFAVRREIINNFLNNLAAAQISVQGIQIAPLALYNFMRFERPELSESVVVDIGAENTDLVVIDGEKLWLRALPSAGNDITKALQKRFNIPYAEAEKLKLKSGKTKQSKKIFEVMKPVLKDIVGEIHRSVGYYKSMAKEIKFQKMVFLGNATKLSGFDQFFSQNLQYEIEVLSEVTNIRVSPKINVNLFQTNIATFAVAMGLAIQGVGLAANNIRLLPEEVWKEEFLKKQKPILVAAVVIMALIPIWLWYSSNLLLKSLTQTNSNVEKVLAPIADKQKQYNQAKQYGTLKTRLLQLTKIGQNRDIWLAIISQINRVFLDATKKSEKEKKGQIWIIDLQLGKKQEAVAGKNQPYIETIFNVAFKSLDDPVKNRDYVKDNFIDPLCLTAYRNEGLLFDSQRTDIVTITNKDTLFPNEQEARSHTFCHVKLRLFSWQQMAEVFTLVSKADVPKAQNRFNESEIPEQISKQLQQKKYPLSDFGASVRVLQPDSTWEIVDEPKNQVFLVLKAKDVLSIYRYR